MGGGEGQGGGRRGSSGDRAEHELPRFQVRFAERLYDGVARWYERDWRNHVNSVSGDNGGVLDREPGVISKIRQAHSSRFLLHPERAEYIGNCMNPECTARVYGMFTLSVMRELASRIGPRFYAARRTALRALARGRTTELRDRCETCGHRGFLFPAESIRNKWIYILKEQGNSLVHYCEIFSETPTTGSVHTRFRNGVYSDSPTQPFHGYVNLLPNPSQFVWHFFLSPVRLGRTALDQLQNSTQAEQSIAQQRSRANPDAAGVPIIAELQPWKTTVRRRFRGQRGRVEIVPLVDSFAWAAQVVDFDYTPMLGALQKLARDADEQSKAFISSMLQQAIGRRQVSENPPTWENDSWDVADDTIDVPQGGSGANIAEAWVNRYQGALEYLTEETNKACARLVFMLRYSLSHRIVEMGCQDWGQTPGYLSYGIVHWAHLLKDILNCGEGQRFAAWLSRGSGSASDPMASSGRIPFRNIIQGEEIRENATVSTEIGAGLLVSVYSALVPSVITRTNQPAQTVVQQLGNINIQATSVNAKDLQSARDLTLDVATGLLQRYTDRLPSSPDFANVHRLNVATNWSERLNVFSRLSQFDKAITLLLSMKAYTESRRDFETGYDRYARISGRIQAPIKAAEFLAKNSRDLVKAQFSGAETRVLGLVERQGVRSLATMAAADYEVYIASRSIRSYQMLSTGVRVLAGPVGVIIGGVETVSQTMQTMDSWEGGDPGAAIGHGLQAAAGVLVIAVACAECAALVSGAAVAAWAGPVGWIAAGLMLIGALVISVWRKNDLELYARHCFLGPDYGQGDWDDQTGKAWMAGLPWPALRYESQRQRRRQSRDRWARQRIALLRLISDFKTWTGPGTYCGGFIYPTFLTDTTYFDVEVDIMPSGRTQPRETYRVKVWPKSREHLWVGPVSSRNRVSVHPSSGTVTGITIRGAPRQIGGSLFDYEIRVRLDLDGRQRNFLPANNRFVINSTHMPGSWRERSPRDAL